MLQQTRVQTVVPYWHRFMDALPTVQALAEAPLERVLTLWSGLGYYRRARMLHEAARQIAEERGGRMPDTASELKGVKGIGRYTAAAIASIAFGRREALVDGNVARVLARWFSVDEDVRRGPGLERVWGLADGLVPLDEPGEWNQAVMELGATICVPKNPRCPLCPVSELCEARSRGLERDLPIRGPKAKVKVLRQVALVVQSGRRVLLGKRDFAGTFAGLWEPPILNEKTTLADAMVRFQGLLNVRFVSSLHAGKVVHILSHRRLEIDVVRATLANSRRAERITATSLPGYSVLEFVGLRSLGERGMSSLARKVLVTAKVR